MKNKIVLLPMFLLVLAACGNNSSSLSPTSQTPGISESSIDVPSDPPSEVTVVSIEEARKLAKDKMVTVQGTITSIYGMASNTHAIIIQEGDFAITLSFVDKTVSAKFAEGNLIRATGEINPYNGLIQLSNTTIDLVQEKGPEIIPLTLTEADWDLDNLKTKDARWVKVEGLKYVKGSVDLTKNSPITVSLGAKELPIYISNYIDLAEKETLKLKFDAIKSTDTITFEGPVGFYNDPQLNPVNANTVTIVEGDEPVGPVLPTTLVFDPSSVELTADETFQTTLIKAPSDSTLDGLVYASTNDAVATVSETGLITAVAAGTTTITAQVGEVKAVFVVNVTIPTSEKLWGIDFKVPANWVKDDKEEGSYYNYTTPWNVTLKDGNVEMDWILRGANPNNLVSEGVRFGGKQTNDKLGEVITDGLPMGEELAAELAATYAQSKAPIVGEVSEVMINIGGDFGTANFTREKVYLQASVDADFTNPINLGSKDAVNGKLVFDLETALEDHYFRVIFGIKHTTTSNGGLLVHEMVFSKALETEIPEAPKAKVAIDNLYTGEAIDTVLALEEAYVIWHNSGVLVLGTQEGTALVNYFNADSTLKATFAGLNKGEYVNMSVKLANNGTGGDFARAVIGIPQVVGGVLYSKVALPSWQFDGMEEATIVKNIAEDGLNWLADATTDFLGTYVKVTAKLVEIGSGDQYYLEYNTAVAGKNAFENGTNYIRLSAYKANQLGFTLELNKTYTIEGIIGGVNKNLPLSGTDNPIFRLYVQTLTEVVA